MKKVTSLALVLMLTALMLTACAVAPAAPASTPAAQESSAMSSEPMSSEPASSAISSDPMPSAEVKTINLAGLKGATTMGMVSLLSKNESGTTAQKYNFTMAVSPDEITPALVKGDIDIAAVPANLASVLYNNTKGEIQVLALNTLNVLYICEKGEAVKDVADLKGKTIYATGKGSVPEYSLRHLLKENGLDPDKDVTIEWKSEPTEVVAVMSEETDAVAMLPQPFVTVAQAQVEGLKIALDVGAEWNKLDGAKLVTGVIIARKAFVEQNPEAVTAFLTEYKASTEWVNDNTDDAAALVEKYGIVKAPIAKKALPLCNITFIDKGDMKTALSAYLDVLMKQNPKAIGGALPLDDFYYEG